MKKNYLFVLFVAMCIIPMNLCAKEVANVKIKKVRYGLYNSNISKVQQNKDAATGQINKVRNIEFIKTTKKIPAEMGVEFGLEWVSKSDNKNDIQITLVWVFPKPMINDKGESFATLPFSTIIDMDEPIFAGFIFEEEYEIVKGKWIFELYHNNKKVLRQKFRVK